MKFLNTQIISAQKPDLVKILKTRIESAGKTFYIKSCSSETTRVKAVKNKRFDNYLD